MPDAGLFVPLAAQSVAGGATAGWRRDGCAGFGPVAAPLGMESLDGRNASRSEEAPRRGEQVIRRRLCLDKIRR
jgi:hypothetical protein